MRPGRDAVRAHGKSNAVPNEFAPGGQDRRARLLMKNPSVPVRAGEGNAPPALPHGLSSTSKASKSVQRRVDGLESLAAPTKSPRPGQPFSSAGGQVMYPDQPPAAPPGDWRRPGSPPARPGARQAVWRTTAIWRRACGAECRFRYRASTNTGSMPSLRQHAGSERFAITSTFMLQRAAGDRKIGASRALSASCAKIWPVFSMAEAISGDLAAGASAGNRVRAFRV